MNSKLKFHNNIIPFIFFFLLFSCEKPVKKEVLSAFGSLNTKMMDSNQIIDQNNVVLLDHLAQKAEDHPSQYRDRLEKATEIRKISADYVAYLESVKAKVTEGFALDEDGNLPFEQMDKGETLDNLFFKGDGTTEEGQEFLSKLKTYNSEIQKVAGSFLF